MFCLSRLPPSDFVLHSATSNAMANIGTLSFFLLIIACTLPSARNVGVLGLRRSCLPKMQCNRAVRGYFLDSPKGHLAISFTSKGPRKFGSCYMLCKATPNCSYWMYHMESLEGKSLQIYCCCYYQYCCRVAMLPHAT